MIGRSAFVASTTAIVLLAASGCASTYHSHSYVEPAPPVAVSVTYFHNDLAPYGRWIEYSPYGWCWTPYAAPLGWRPYSDGYWAYTDVGWSWVSYEPWGWATYHYGRWAYDSFYGWIWVPGSVWAPSWVAWHHGNGWVGWAPLPPDAHWDVHAGLKYRHVDRIPPGQWCFVEQRHLSQTKLKTKIVSVARNETLFKQTRDGTRYSVRGGKPVNEGLEVAAVERTTDRKFQRLEVADAQTPQKGERVASGKVEYFRPEVREADLKMAPPAEIRKPDAAMSETELHAQAEKDRREMEGSLAKERAQLQRAHEQELADARGPQASVSPEEVEKRQAAENEAFEKHAAAQRQVLEQRQEKQIVKQKAPRKQPRAKSKQSAQPAQGASPADSKEAAEQPAPAKAPDATSAPPKTESTKKTKGK
jgi:hypothetical protein